MPAQASVVYTAAYFEEPRIKGFNMSNFSSFAGRIKGRFDTMSQGELFTVDLPVDAVWHAYLAAFPEGTNPVYIKNTEHDCSCCRHFVRNIGHVVTIKDGKMSSVWDVEGLEYPYDVVAAALSTLVKKARINALYRTPERRYGNKSTIARLENGDTRSWNHFYCEIAGKHVSDSGEQRGKYNTAVNMLKRGLEKLTVDAFDTVIDLIEQKLIYRGEEFLEGLKGYRSLLKQYQALTDDAQRNAFLWSNGGNHLAYLSGNVEGGFVEMVAAGEDLDKAVRAFESHVAPANYQRSSAVITENMVKDAMKTVRELGLEEALERRHAKLSDISVNNVLWVNNDVRPRMRDGVEGVLLAAVTAPKSSNVEKATDISIEEFMSSILPRATAMDVLIKNAQQANFMSLTAPVHADAGRLFKWDNNFVWSYDGNVTDSIRERVKSAGGRTEAVMRVSLAWFNYDDLDIHAIEPNGYEIYYGNRGCASSGNRGMLDVDMNSPSSTKTREAVENIVWDTPGDGVYRIEIHNYQKRESTNVGFTLEVENAGQVHQYSCATSPSDGSKVLALKLTVKNRRIVEISVGKGITGGSFSAEKWGVATEAFTKVNTVMFSPNYWDDNKTGNKHWFFILEGCRNPDPVRGVYNEFLRSDLLKHRKVFEVLGNQMKCEPAQDQLSGIGFSSTCGDSVMVRVTTEKQQKVYKVNF